MTNAALPEHQEVIVADDNKLSRNHPLSFLQQPQQRHSLRINVSDVAACAGFHPFKCLPKLFLQQHVYQGREGQRCLELDARLLGLKLVSEEELWMQIAEQAGKETQQAFQKAQTQKQSHIQAVRETHTQIIETAQQSSKLSKEQLTILQEGVRHTMYTGFGRHWEDDALNEYEKQCGWEVTERNAEIREWKFDQSGQELAEPASVHLSKPSPHPATHNKDADITLLGDETIPKRQKINSEHETKAGFIDLTGSDSEKDNQENAEQKMESNLKATELPFFRLRGSVDGIRQEMAPVVRSHTQNKTFDRPSYDDDSWDFRSVIVECKHRMNRLQETPPLYEVIQATTYCLMYQVQEADIVQVLRYEKPRTSISKLSGENMKEKKKAAKNDDCNSDKIVNNCLSKDSKVAEIQIFTSATKEAKVKDPDKEEDTNMKILVSRISIEESTHQHRHNWYAIVLPRLLSWTKAVYSVRGDDIKRYRFLHALAKEDLQSAWELLFQECSWLKECDTSYLRDIATASDR